VFAIVSEKYQYIVGVDTHAQKHVATIVDNHGVVLASREVRVTSSQMNSFISWVRKVTDNAEAVLLAVEGTSSYGETLTKLALASGLDITEVRPPKTKSRGGSGKTDHIDAELAALSVLRLPVDRLITPRSGTARKGLRILLSARRNMVSQQVANKNTLMALLRGCDLGIDARRTLKLELYRMISLWQYRAGDDQEQAIARYETKRLATSVLSTGLWLEQNEIQLAGLANMLAPGLLDMRGLGPVTAAQLICSYSHKGRVRSAAAFAALAGTTPIPASSGNVVRHRLNRFGDRALNGAIHTVALARIRCDDATKAYVAKRTAEGQSKREIRRSLKRYIARSLFKQLETYNIGG
jgi:transposase